MLEAMISLRMQGELPGKKRGDILCAKLPGSPWGKKESLLNLIIEMEDPELEAELNRQLEAGEQYPVVILPYQESDGAKARRSMKRFRVDKLPVSVQAVALNASVRAAIVPLSLAQGLIEDVHGDD